MRFAVKNLPHGKSAQISVRDALFAAAPIGFIVLREVMRNGGIYHIPVQRLHSLMNHRAVQCVRFAAKIFMNFTRIDFRAEKMSRLCTARYGKADFCTLLYAGFAYRTSIQR